MSSGFSGGGAADFYGAGGVPGRSIAMNNAQASYRSQLPGIFANPSAQIVQRRHDLIGKRSLAEFQTQNTLHHHHLQQQPQQGMGLFLRSVKPRTYHHTSPISPLSPVDFAAATSISPEISSISASPVASGRYGLPLVQQLRTQPNNLVSNVVSPFNSALSGVSYSNLVQNRVQIRSAEADSEKKMMTRLQELEKQLLDDTEENEAEAVSVITNSEWSETIQNLITPNQNPISPSPTTSTSSSSSSASVASPPTCPKQSVVHAASAIAEGSTDKALEILTRVVVPNAQGSADQRMAAHVAAALRWRVNPADQSPPVPELYKAAAMQMLFELSPCFKLGLYAANQAILDATSDLPDTIHVVDFDAINGGGFGVQYCNLIQALAARQNSKPVVLKITSVSEPANGNGAEEKLKKLGERVGVSVKLNVVSLGLCDLTRDSLACEPDDAVVVNLAFTLYKMPDESVRTDNPRDELLRRVKALRPRVVAVVEQELNGNTAPFVARVSEVCAYYGALFESLDSTVPKDNPDRVQVEEGLSRKMANSVACEGMHRVERCEVFGKWRARLGMAGFESRPLSQSVAESLKARVNSCTRGNMGFAVKEEAGGICFSWMGRTLTVASGWR